MDLEDLCENVTQLAKEVGHFILSERNNSEIEVETKSLNSLVTYVDKEAEIRIVKRLQELLPNSGFIAEEGTSTKKGEEYNWIIDPLDGTTNFIHSIPVFSVSIALMKNEKLVLGVVYEINRKECFYAWEDSKAYLNGKEIQVSKTNKIANSLLATGFPYYDYGRLKSYTELLAHFMQHTRGLRRLGSAATDLAYVACGRFDAFYEYGLSPWDVAAGAFIVQQAGGKITDFSGENDFVFGKEILASNELLHSEMETKIKKYFD